MPPRDFALAEPKMHQNLCQFIHIKFEQFVGHRKRKQHFKSKNVVVAAKKKLWREMRGKSSAVSKCFYKSRQNLQPLHAKVKN